MTDAGLIDIPRGQGPDPGIVIVAETIAEIIDGAAHHTLAAIIVKVEEVHQDLDPGIAVYMIAEIDAHADAVIPAILKSYGGVVALVETVTDGKDLERQNVYLLSFHHRHLLLLLLCLVIAQSLLQRSQKWMNLQPIRISSLIQSMLLKPGMLKAILLSQIL